GELGEPWIGRMGLAVAILVVQVGAALRAQAPAIAPADGLHGDGQVHLLGQGIGEEEAGAFEESHFRLFFVQLDLLFGADRVHGTVEEIEIAADLLGYGVEAAGAHQLDARVQLATEANLPVHEFGGGTHLKDVRLTEVFRVVINRAGWIELLDAELPDRQFLDVEEHRWSPSFSRLPSQRRAIIGACGNESNQTPG